MTGFDDAREDDVIERFEKCLRTGNRNPLGRERRDHGELVGHRVDVAGGRKHQSRRCQNARCSGQRQELLVHRRHEKLNVQLAAAPGHLMGEGRIRSPWNLMAPVSGNGRVDHFAIGISEMQVKPIAKQPPYGFVAGATAPGEQDSHLAAFPCCFSSTDRRSINTVYRCPKRSTKAGYRSLSTTRSKLNCSAIVLSGSSRLS